MSKKRKRARIPYMLKCMRVLECINDFTTMSSYATVWEVQCERRKFIKYQKRDYISHLYKTLEILLRNDFICMMDSEGQVLCNGLTLPKGYDAPVEPDGQKRRWIHITMKGRAWMKCGIESRDLIMP